MRWCGCRRAREANAEWQEHPPAGCGRRPEGRGPSASRSGNCRASPSTRCGTRAALLLSENVNPKIVQEMLGHATISQTMDTYSHVMPGTGDVAAEALESALP